VLDASAPTKINRSTKFVTKYQHICSSVLNFILGRSISAPEKKHFITSSNAHHDTKKNNIDNQSPLMVQSCKQT